MMHGRMMDFPLVVSHLVERARVLFPDTEVVSRRPDGSLVRHTWGQVLSRAAQLARALERLGVKHGDRVATLCWNHHQHLEAYLAIPSFGAVLHTLNLRLHPSEIGYIARHAGDSVVIVDRSLLPLFEQFRSSIPTLEHVIVVGDDGPVAEGQLDFDALLRAESDAPFAWPELDERAAAMICYTSGTTGNPKGVVYSHRSTVLHALASSMVDSMGVREADTILPVVPLFHAAGWGLPFAAVCNGAKVVFPGPKLDPASLLDLMAEEKVTLAAGVPTIWIGILALLDQSPKKWDLTSVRAMLIGGSAAPPSMIQGFADRHGLSVIHAWGMTETSPLGSTARLRRGLSERSPDERLAALSSQGIASPFVEMRHVGEGGEVLPRDGTSMGELHVRGPWVASSYFSDEDADRFTADGWFKTGDVVTIDALGYMRITDRSKDVVKSGGEWISSVALENAIMSHPAVLEAAVFAAQHEKWGERPVAAIVTKPGQSVSHEELTAFLAPQFAKFWLPDELVFVPQIPRTSTGKFLKTKLRADHGDILLKGRAK
jgi:fatty-acyl-CoA synthase